MAIPVHHYSGASALIHLHEIYLKKFYTTWKEAKEKAVVLPATEDPNYKSLETLLFHVLRAARNYMVWMCAKLELPDPEIALPPDPDVIGVEAEQYIRYMLSKWETPLKDVIEDKFIKPTFMSNWGTPYCIDAMLEHAVMHPIRHENQLSRLIREQKQP